MIDRKIKLVLSFICCTKRNRNGVIALNANKLINKIVEKGFTICDISNLLGIQKIRMNNVDSLTIGEVLALKNILELSDTEAISIFLGA